MLTEEAVNATTVNTAYALGEHRQVGSITVGKRANFFITKPMDSIYFMSYGFGENKIEQHFLNGKRA